MIEVYNADGSLHAILEGSTFDHAVVGKSATARFSSRLPSHEDDRIERCRVSPGERCAHGYYVQTPINIHELLALIPKQEGPDWVDDTLMAALKRGSSKSTAS